LHPVGLADPLQLDPPLGNGYAHAPVDPAAPPSPTTPLGSAKDIAWAVVYLASDESRFVSGQKMVVDNTLTVTPGVVPYGPGA
jgi:NAD(P)-dependent dehydrogenase (short-subunit alcohol dehydrogenase family)